MEYSCEHSCMNRRRFLELSALGAAAIQLPFGSKLFSSENAAWNPHVSPMNPGLPLRVQPVLLYEVAQRRPATSWRNWGGIHSEQDAAEELGRIAEGWKALASRAEFPLRFLPAVKIKSKEEAATIRDADGYDTAVVYAAGGWVDALEACFSEKRNNLIFLRHKSGPVYLWYEIVHNRFLRQGGEGLELDQFRYPLGMTVDDVVVDDPDELLSKLRTLYAVRNFMGKRIVALGGSGGWCCPPAPSISQGKFKIDIRSVPYDDLAGRIRSAKNDRSLQDRAAKSADAYLGLKHTRLETEKKFVVNAFVLYGLIQDIMREHDTDAFTINNCMDTVIPMAETTACLPLSLLNDGGAMAFCESDFNVIPSGILLRYITGKPVFLNDPTYPHRDMVTVAHCTAPRRMDGKTWAPARILTHFESDYGAAPKVELPRGTRISMVCPDGGQKKWVGFTGTVEDNPFLDICRTQFDVRIDGNWDRLLHDHRGFHWMMAVGDAMKEMEYACAKIGVEWENTSEV